MVVSVRRRQTPRVIVPGAEDGETNDGSWAEQIDYSQLATGHEGGRPYARPIDQKWVDDLAQQWDPNKLDVLHVSFTEDAEKPLVIIAGNHRELAARKRGEPFKFWCIVYPGLTLEQEADKFHAIDQKRKRHSVADGYRAAIVFNDPRTKDIDRILTKYGLSTAEYVQAKGKVGEVRAIGSLYRAYDYAYPDTALLDRAIGILHRAWGSNSGPHMQPTVNGYTIEAMVAFLWRYMDLPQFNENKLVRAMQSQEAKPYGLRDFSATLQRLRVEHQKLYGKSGNSNLRFGMEALLRLYNRKREAAFKLPSRWVRVSRALVKAEKAAYLAAGLTGDVADAEL